MAEWPSASAGRGVTALPSPAASPLGRLLGPSDPSQVTPYHHKARGQVAELRVGEEALYSPGHRRAILTIHAEHGDARMTPRRVSADIAEPPVEGDQEAASLPGGVEDRRIIRATQALLGDGVDVVSQRLRRPASSRRQVLVQLQLQPGEGSRGKSSSWASRAA